jgi:hypothetical protein
MNRESTRMTRPAAWGAGIVDGTRDEGRQVAKLHRFPGPSALPLALLLLLLLVPALAAQTGPRAERRAAAREAQIAAREAAQDSGAAALGQEWFHLGDTPPEGLGELARRRAEVAEFVRGTFPELARQLEQLRREDPVAFQRKRQAIAREALRLLELRDRDGTLFQLAVEELRQREDLERLAAKCRRERDAARRAELETELRNKVGAAFDLRQRIKEAEVADLDRKLAELRDGLSRRAERRDELIEAKLGELLRSESDW